LFEMIKSCLSNILLGSGRDNLIYKRSLTATCTAPNKSLNIMSYAIVEAGGTQLRVEPGRFYDINHLHADPNETYTIDKVLLVNADDQVTIGQPFVEGAMVVGTILSHLRGRKIIVYKMRPKKKTRKKRGHRQELTRLLIESISVNGTVVAERANDNKPVLSEPDSPDPFETELEEV